MMVTVRIGGREATVTGGRWESDDPLLLDMLRGDAEIRRTFGYDPFPDLTMAQEAIAAYGGEIVAAVAPESVEGRVY